MPYATPPGGLPAQAKPLNEKAVFTTAYAFIPARVMTDIVTSFLPHWTHTRAWIIARPLSGFAETFAQLIVEVAPGGGSKNPEPDPMGEGVIFVVAGEIELELNGEEHTLGAGGYAFCPPGAKWALANTSDENATFHWVRKRYQPVDDIPYPAAFVTSDQETAPSVMPDCDGVWSTTRFVEPDDLRHDMHVNIVNFKSGGNIPFAETHIMEHGLYVLEGTAKYLLNTDWVDVGPGDFMWLRAFCPQACYCEGDGDFRYLLYKDVNRHPALTITGS